MSTTEDRIQENNGAPAPEEVRESIYTAEQLELLRKVDELARKAGSLTAACAKIGINKGIISQLKNEKYTGNAEAQFDDPYSVDPATLHWGFLSEYERIVIGESVYYRIGNRLYTLHAAERTLPRGYSQLGRSVPPAFIEEVIQNGQTQVYLRNGEIRTSHTLGTLQVVTSQQGRIVITVITR